MKTCSKCKKEYLATLEYFPPNKKCKLGLNSHCRICKREANRIASRNWCKQNYQNNPEKEKTRVLKNRENNRKQYNRYSTIYKSAVRNKRIKHARTNDPKIVEQIKEIYYNRPEGFTVDHIIPLKGKVVSGLHVPWNLQYLTKSENSSKRNKFEPYKEKVGI